KERLAAELGLHQADAAEGDVSRAVHHQPRAEEARQETGAVYEHAEGDQPQSPKLENGLVSPSVEGTPQGGPLSPLLSNLVLDELDRELERRGHRYVRYADDSNIY